MIYLYEKYDSNKKNKISVARIDQPFQRIWRIWNGEKSVDAERKAEAKMRHEWM